MTDSGKVIQFPVKLTRYILRDEITIPPRPWIMRGLLIRKQVTSLIAAGGAGKSIFGLTIAMHLAAGRDFGPFKCVGGPFRVAVLSVEEDQDELDRRIHAIAKAYKFTQQDLLNLYIINATADDPIVATVGDGNSKVVRKTKFGEEMERLLFRDAIDVVMLDPFVEIWDGDENSNGQVKGAAAIIRNMVRRLNAACLLMHHVRKGVLTPGDVDGGRGASSLSGLVRLAHTVTNMTKEEAALFQIPNPKGIIRVDHAKGNYLPAPERAAWFKFEQVELDNADPAFGTVGDRVGVLKPWELPGLFDGVDLATIDLILAAIDKGTGVERWSLAPQSKDRFVGVIIAQIAEINAERAAKIAATWKKSGLLFEEEYTSFAQRKKLKGIRVDWTKRPSDKPEDTTKKE